MKLEKIIKADASCLRGFMLPAGRAHRARVFVRNRQPARGGARNFLTGADSSDENAKILLSGYYKFQKSLKNRFSPSDGGL